MLVPIHKKEFTPLPIVGCLDEALNTFVCEPSSTVLPEFKTSHEYKLVKTRLEGIGVQVSDKVIAFIAAISTTPGQMVLYCHAVAREWVDEIDKSREFSIRDFVTMFPIGFPGEEDLTRFWKEQKCKGLNMVDLEKNWI